MTLLTQSQIEERMVAAGVVRSREAFEGAESRGHAEQNPYATTIYRDFVEPLAGVVQRAMEVKGAAQRQAHVVLMRPLDHWAVAYIAVRVAMTTILAGQVRNGKSLNTVRHLGYTIGKAIHSELYLSQFQELAPDLFFILTEDLGRRKSRDVDHRLKVFRQQAASAGLHIVEWGAGNRDQVGLWLMEQMERLGMIVMEQPKAGPGRRQSLYVHLTAEVMDTVDNVKGHFEMNRPFYAPCVEVPKDWVTWDNGGFHTNAMRRSLPYCVKAKASIRDLIKAKPDMPIVLQCLNTLQRTAWKINGRVADTVIALAQDGGGGDEIVTPDDSDKPQSPEWLETVDETERTEEQQEEFKAWKKVMSAWYTDTRLKKSARGRLGEALRTVIEYRKYPAIYFVHFCDSRGRVYPLTSGVSPQGSDLQKGLIHFAQGLPITDPAATGWFLIHGANKWGFDKATLPQRRVWHEERRDLILAFASDPLGNRGWLEADKPLQFLAWCFEYQEWCSDPASFVSHLPVSLDGSCSGLQHFSAMLRDPIGAKATNLANNPTMQDIYKYVADATVKRMEWAETDEDGYQRMWLDHGITRAVTKRMTMTTPYGVTKRSAVKYVIEDYLKKKPEFAVKEHYGTAHYLLNYAWPAIGDVVVKGRQAMDWLTKSAKAIIKANLTESGDISWDTPSGFPAAQAYYTLQEHSVSTKVYGHARIKVVTEKDEASKERHAQGLAPNFVHSMDAAHLHLTTAYMDNMIPGISLAMIHDDFGTHAAHTEELFHGLRRMFVDMYTKHDPLEDLHRRYEMTTPPPEKGDFDLNEVLDSQFAFS